MIGKAGVWPGRAPVPNRGGHVALIAQHGNELPVMFEEVAYEIHSKWTLPMLPSSENGQFYARTVLGRPQRFLVGDVGLLAKGETWNREHVVDRTAAPADAVELYHAWCTIVRVIVVDDVGRRWRIRSARRGRAKRLRWYHRWNAPWPSDSSDDELWAAPGALAARGFRHPP